MRDCKLIAPNVLTRGDAKTVIGATVWLAVSALLEAGGRMGARELCAAVYGPGSVRGKWCLKSLCQRVSAALAAVGAPERCGVDGQDVTLV